jgi:hypothetical protein
MRGLSLSSPGEGEPGTTKKGLSGESEMIGKPGDLRLFRVCFLGVLGGEAG